MRRWAQLCLFLLAAPWALAAHEGTFHFEAYEKKPGDWYASAEARQLADHLLEYQDPSGGWPKNRHMTLSPAEEAAQRKVAHDETLPTIDNGATYDQLQFLARVQSVHPDARYLAAIERGIDYLLAAQYENGGWPQFYPLIVGEGYHDRITFNDDAMVNVLDVLRAVAQQRPPFAMLDSARRNRAAKAVEKGIDCILRCQIVVDGVKTAWCAQHDQKTFAPVPARKFEPASLSGAESVGIVRFLMGEENPSPEIITAVHAAAAWLKQVELKGVREEHPPIPGQDRRFDRVLVADPNGAGLWARFYEIGTNRPIYSGRDSVVRYKLEEIELERRSGYNWHVTLAAKLLGKEYPAWARKWPAPEPGVKEFSLENAEKPLKAKYPALARPSPDLPPGVIAAENLTYARPDGQILQLDIYRPMGFAPHPVVLLVHGGGWETGSRHMERAFAKQLAARGYVTVPVSYRLGARGRFPAPIEDLKAAIGWLKANATDLALDHAPVGVIGGSAGGQLAALLGAENQAPLPIGAVADIDGLADFTGQELLDQQLAKPSSPVRFLGGPFAERADVWRAASAITHAGPHSAPTLFINSTSPTPILPGREAMRDKLKAAGVASEIVTIPDTPHPFWLFHPWFPRVVDEADRFLRQHLAGTVELTVAADGSAAYNSVQAAISAAPMLTGVRDPRIVIRVKPGTYRERVYVQQERGNITVIGEDAATTVIAYDLHANLPGPDGKPIGTFRTPTVQIDGDGMTWENITFANTAGEPGPREGAPAVAQALALRVDGDRVTFRNCRFLGWQDTILVNRGRHYFSDCYIEGSVDFIFGAGTSYFDRCEIHCLRNGYITAASTPEGKEHGLVFADCRITGADGVSSYLGRPWRDFARTVFLRTEMDAVIKAEGWHNWNKPRAEQTAFYAEFDNRGPGAAGPRAPWIKSLTAEQVGAMTPTAVLGGADGWNPLGGIAVHLAGDSTMANKVDPDYPERGWGQALRAFVPPTVRLVNHAVNGRSTKSFRDRGHWQRLLEQLHAGDWVIVQFGHNDEKQQDPAVYADAQKDYPDNLRRFIAEVRAKGAHPVLATPVVRRDWGPDGTLRDTHGAYPAAVRAVAAAEKVPLLDLEVATRGLLLAEGLERSKDLFLVYAPKQHPRFPDGKTDNTHFNETGARRVAALAVEEMKKLRLPFADALAAGQTPGAR